MPNFARIGTPREDLGPYLGPVPSPHTTIGGSRRPSDEAQRAMKKLFVGVALAASGFTLSDVGLAQGC